MVANSGDGGGSALDAAEQLGALASDATGATAPPQASAGGRVVAVAPSAGTSASKPLMHERHAVSLSAAGNEGDSAMGAMFSQGLGNPAANAAGAAAAAAAAAASAHRPAAEGGPCEPPVATDDAPPGEPNGCKAGATGLARVYVPHAQSLTNDACVSVAHLDSAAMYGSDSAAAHPQLQPSAVAAAQSPARPAPARAVNFAAAVAGPVGRHADVLQLAGTTMAAAPCTPQAAAQLPQHASRTMVCLLYTSPSPRDRTRSRMPSSA